MTSQWTIILTTDEAATVEVGGVRHRMGWGLLAACANQVDADLSAAYRSMLADCRADLAARKWTAERERIGRMTPVERRDAQADGLRSEAATCRCRGDHVLAEQAERTIDELVVHW